MSVLLDEEPVLSAVVPTPSKSALAATLRRVSPRTLALLNDQLVTSAPARAVEPAKTVRMDATVVPVAIQSLTDSSLLLDGVRMLCRLVRPADREVGFTAYHRHVKRAKRRAMEIAHLAPQATVQRYTFYRELVQLTKATASYATCALAHLEGLASTRGRDRRRTQFTTLLPRVAQMIDQATRRVVHGEAVPAEEKIVSLFEAHTDVLVKDRCDTLYGHKVFLTTGRAGLILDCAIPKGNPGDVTWTVPLVRRQDGLFGTVPRQVRMDGAFASKDDFADLKKRGAAGVCFAKELGSPCPRDAEPVGL